MNTRSRSYKMLSIVTKKKSQTYVKSQDSQGSVKNKSKYSLEKKSETGPLYSDKPCTIVKPEINCHELDSRSENKITKNEKVPKSLTQPANLKTKPWFCNRPLSPVSALEIGKNSNDTHTAKTDGGSYEIGVNETTILSGKKSESVKKSILTKTDTSRNINNKNENEQELPVCIIKLVDICNRNEKLPDSENKNDNEQELPFRIEKIVDISDRNENPPDSENKNENEQELAFSIEKFVDISDRNENPPDSENKNENDQELDFNIDKFDDLSDRNEKSPDSENISSSEEDPFANSDDDDPLYVPSDEEKNSSPNTNLSEYHGAQPNTIANPEFLKKIYKRNPDFCYYCEEEIFNFARHVKRNHPMENEVVNIFSKPTKSKERRQLLNCLRRKGNYLKNSSECYKAVRKSALPNRQLLPCDNCLGFFSSKLLYRHKKQCGGSSSTAQASGQTCLLGSLKVDQQLREQVFPGMRADKVSLAAKKDILICAFGARYLKTHREKHFINVTSRKMRELGRMLIEIKNINPEIKNLFLALQPKNFDVLVEATKKVARYDSAKSVFASPTIAMNIATSLKQCCDIAITYALKRQAHYGTIPAATAEAELKTMIHLLTANWKYEISSQAASDLNLKKWNKVTIVPLARDLKVLREYLQELASKSIATLTTNENSVSAYTSLLEAIYCRVILLNRRRSGELQRVLLETYLHSGNAKHYEEFEAVISSTEKVLLNNFKRIVIRGKRGKGVPVLFSSDVQEHITLLLQFRPKFVPEDNLFLFGRPKLTTAICGYKVLQKHVNACGAKNPSAIASNRLRKHLATLSQIFNMSENEMEQLATFMGHTTGVHKSSYRLPDDVYQTAKVSKILLLMEKGNAANFKGKALDDIDVDMEENICEDHDSGDDSDEGELHLDMDTFNQPDELNPSSATVSAASVSGKGKVRHVPWTSQQKLVVKEFFKKHINQKRSPKRHECEEVIERHPELFNNKNWLKMKVFIQNEYTKKKS